MAKTKPTPPKRHTGDQPAHVRSRVLACKRVHGPTADVWSGRRLVIVELLCGHVIRKLSYRRYLSGELLVCKQCTIDVRAAEQPLPFDWAGR